MLAENVPAEDGGDGTRARRPRIIIVGAGFAGVAAARALKRSDADVVLIDRRNHHIFQPLLYQVATAVLGPSEIAAPIRQMEARQANLHVMLADVCRFEPLHGRCPRSRYRHSEVAVRPPCCRHGYAP